MRVNSLIVVVAAGTLAVGALSNCTCDNAPPPVSAAHLDLDVLLGPGEVRCGPITKASELIGGPAAYAQVGHAFRCGNALIRFVVQDGVRPVGNSVEGGTLIDVDRAGDDEAVDGEDTFREFVPLMGFSETHVEEITVVNDGTNGEPGVIRVSGTPTTITLAPAAAALDKHLQGRTFTDYILEKDSDTIKVTTTFENAGENALFGITGADFLAFGGATPPLTPNRGFGDVPLFSQVDFIVGTRGKSSNIAYVCDNKEMTIPLVESGATVGFCDELNINAEGSFTRFLVVGDGSAESVARRAFELRGIATGTVSGSVDGAGSAFRGASAEADLDVVEDVVVTALTGALDDDGSHAVNEARVGRDGRFSITLPPGDYQLIAHVPSTTGARAARSAAVAVSVVEGADTASASLALGASGRIVVDTEFVGADALLAAKLTLVPLDATQQPARDILHDYSEHGSRYAVSADGHFDVDVPPGRYRLLVSRGFEFSRHDEEVDVEAGATVDVDAVVERVIDTNGFLAGEFHQHSLGSIDAVVPVPIKVLENAAEGIEVAVATDHDNIVDFDPFVDVLGLADQLIAFPGEEVSYQGIGHFNAFPFVIDPADPFRDIGSRMWWLKTVPQMFRDIRAAAGGDAIVQLNHPRSDQGQGSLASLNFDPSNGARIPRDDPSTPTFPVNVYRAWSPAFDAIEVNTNLGDASQFTADRAALHALAEDNPTNVPVLADWFGLMGAGLTPAAMGNSDTHRMNNGVGYPRTYIFTGTDDPTTLTREQLMATIRAQKTAIAEGCLLTLEVDGAPRMGHGDLLAASEGAQLTARLQAPPHVTVSRLELYVNGVAQTLSSSAQGQLGVDAAGVLSLPLANVVDTTSTNRLRAHIDDLVLDEDSVVVVVEKGGSGLDPTGGGSVVCVSPAAYVDVDGDGEFAPWLAATEQVLAETE